MLWYNLRDHLEIIVLPEIVSIMTAACNGCFIFWFQILTHVGYVFQLHAGRSQINGEIQVYVTQLNYSHPQFELFTCLLLALFSQLHVEDYMPPISSLAPWENIKQNNNINCLKMNVSACDENNHKYSGICVICIWIEYYWNEIF